MFCTFLISFTSVESAMAVQNVNKMQETNATYELGIQEINNAISSYKKGDYLSCISILKDYTMRYDNNATAWYYLGNSYMNIAMVNEANEAFNKVIQLNTVPKLTSYSIQAQLCMKNPVGCKYENFTASEIRKLRENPTGFINSYYRALNQETVKSDDVIQIIKKNMVNHE